MNALKNFAKNVSFISKRGVSQSTPKMAASAAVSKTADEDDITNIPQEFKDEPHVHIAFLKVKYLFEVMKVQDDSEKEKIWKTYDLSPGWSSLDWVWQNPPPFHTYDELPIVKHFEGVRKPHH